MLVGRACKSVEMTLNEKQELTLLFFPNLVSSPLLCVLLENAFFYINVIILRKLIQISGKNYPRHTVELPWKCYYWIRQSCLPAQ